MGVWRYIVVFSSLTVLCICRDVAYYELKTLGVSCSPHDTCNTTSANREASGRNCQCDNDCAYFGDCCLDVGISAPSKSVASTDLVCQRVRSNTGYFTIGKCRRGWRDDGIKRKCENHPDPQDPFSSTPVSTTRTAFTYKNKYCATCNNVRDRLLYWKLGAECLGLNSSMDNYVQRNLTYDRNASSWGVNIERRFHSCTLKPVPPNEKRYLRSCYPNLISKCSPRWTDQFIRDKCESYTAYLHIREERLTYRNVHCAICNNVRPSSLSCDPYFAREFERTSFTTLFDIDLSKGNEIGGSGPQCKKDEVYDPAFKRCQMLSCGLPFLELRDGVCVPKRRK